jgi:hypothetical protein
VICPERASAACALDELREKVTQIRKIGTRIRKNAFAGPTQSLKSYQPASIFDCVLGPIRCRRRGKDEARSTDFFQSRNFCAALKNKVQIFACRFFSAFLISRRWQGARESSGVNKV